MTYDDAYFYYYLLVGWIGEVNVKISSNPELVEKRLWL